MSSTLSAQALKREQREKARAALAKAKEQEATRLRSGFKYVRTDGKTLALKSL